MVQNALLAGLATRGWRRALDHLGIMRSNRVAPNLAEPARFMGRSGSFASDALCLSPCPWIRNEPRLDREHTTTGKLNRLGTGAMGAGFRATSDSSNSSRDSRMGINLQCRRSGNGWGGGWKRASTYLKRLGFSQESQSHRPRWPCGLRKTYLGHGFSFVSPRRVPDHVVLARIKTH